MKITATVAYEFDIDAEVPDDASEAVKRKFLYKAAYDLIMAESINPTIMSCSDESLED